MMKILLLFLLFFTFSIFPESSLLVNVYKILLETVVQKLQNHL